MRGACKPIKCGPATHQFWDVAGPFRYHFASAHGVTHHIYACIFVCRYSGAVWTYGFTKKSQLPQILQLHVDAMQAISTVLSMVRLRGDMAAEMHGAECQQVLSRNKITQEDAVEYDHATNAPAERMIQTLFGDVRAMLRAAHLPEDCWELALLESARVRSVVPTKRSGQWLSPHFLLYGTKPDVSSLRAFGSHAWPHIAEKARTEGKLSSARADCGILVGSDLDTGLYTVLLAGAIVRRTRCCKIDESPVIEAMAHRQADDLRCTEDWLTAATGADDATPSGGETTPPAPPPSACLQSGCGEGPKIASG